MEFCCEHQLIITNTVFQQKNRFCSEHQLVITNTVFRQKDRLKAAWRHPCFKHSHLLDYALTRQRDTSDILHTTVIPSVDCYTDHRLVRCTVAFAFKPPSKRKIPQTNGCKCTEFVTQGWKTIFRLRWRRDFIV